MSVNVGQRHVPDTPANRQLDACQKAMELAIHTIKICGNEKVFYPEYRDSLTNDIIICAKDIYVFAWNANNIYVTKNNQKRWTERERYQILALTKCNELLALINIARRLFHLKGSKYRYWSQMVLEARLLISNWHIADFRRFKQDVG